MAPIEVFRGDRVNPAQLRNLEGRRVFGIICYSSEKEISSLQELQECLEEILTRNDADGISRSESTKEGWLSRKKYVTDEYGKEALINLMPIEGHKQITEFINALHNAGIFTITHLLEQKDRIEKIPRIGSKRLKAVRLIIKYLQEEQKV